MDKSGHHEPAVLQEARSVRYLKLIALFKIAKAVLLLVLGVSLLSLDTWGSWMNAPLKWIANEILLQHSYSATKRLVRIAPVAFHHDIQKPDDQTVRQQDER